MPSRFSACRLRRSASFHCLTGVSVASFERMPAPLRGPWEAAERGQAKSGRPRAIGGLAEHLLVLLLCYRGDVTQQVLGLFDGVDRSPICRAIRPTEAQVKPLLALCRAPKISRREAEASSIDGTELADPAAERRCHAAGALLGHAQAPHPDDRAHPRRHRADRQRLRRPPRQPA
jgi:hypothetical protein